MPEPIPAGPALPIVSLQTRTDRWLLGAYFALMLYVVAPLEGLAHEGSHAIGHLLAGDPVRAIFISPFIGQVLALYPAGRAPVQGWISAAGPLGGLLLGYLVTGLYLRKRRAWGLWGDSALLMIIWATLLAEPGYVIAGSLGNFGDPQQMAAHLGVSRWLVFAVGLVMVLVNAPLLHRAFARWRRTYAPQSQPRQLGSAINVFLLCIVLIGIPYWIPITSYLGRHQ
jgi:hypothetical protein